ncbi:MAG: hypothetical protein ACUVRD_02305 [Bacteroidia bacterium]
MIALLLFGLYGVLLVWHVMLLREYDFLPQLGWGWRFLRQGLRLVGAALFFWGVDAYLKNPLPTCHIVWERSCGAAREQAKALLEGPAFTARWALWSIEASSIRVLVPPTYDKGWLRHILSMAEVGERADSWRRPLSQLSSYLQPGDWVVWLAGHRAPDLPSRVYKEVHFWIMPSSCMQEGEYSLEEFAKVVGGIIQAQRPRFLPVGASWIMGGWVLWLITYLPWGAWMLTRSNPR